MIGRSEIERLIPHAGRMCLLDRVIRWNSKSITCLSRTHVDPANPLAFDGGLGAACGVEYAAQAMAVHGGLMRTQVQRPQTGYLASVRSLILHVPRLDDIEGDLIIEAERLAGEGAPCAYRFELGCAGKILVEGRAAVLLDTAPA